MFLERKSHRKMKITTIRQLFVASSIQLASITSGGVMGLPGVLLKQFKRSDSPIQLDLNTASWIASVHGLAGTSSLIMPYLMQWQGRRFALRTICMFFIIGWLIIYSAKDSLTVIIGELFQGVSYKSLCTVSFMTISEMVEPKFRNQFSVLYGVFQTSSIIFIHTIGKYVSWRTICLIMCTPAALSFLFSFIWPESPAWLAFKGRFEESEKSFIWLRGQNVNSAAEMHSLLNTQKAYINSNKSIMDKKSLRQKIRDMWSRLSGRDFYLPSFHIFILLSSYYCTGNIVLVIYAENLVEKCIQEGESAYIGTILIDIALFLSNICSVILLQYFNNKPIVLLSGVGTVFMLLGMSSITYLQYASVISSDSLICLYLLVGFMMFSTVGFYIIPFVIAAELMPLKHRGIGGSLVILFICLLSSMTLKIAPYLISYIGLYGTFLMYAITLSICLFIIWKYIPETKNKTLQSIEAYYAKNVTNNRENFNDDVHKRLKEDDLDNNTDK